MFRASQKPLQGEGFFFVLLTHWLTGWYRVGGGSGWKLSFHTAMLAFILWSLNTQYTVTFSLGLATTFLGM